MLNNIIQKIKDLLSNHSGKLNIASYSALIITGVTGYTHLMQNYGKLDATVEFQKNKIQELHKDIDRTTVLYSKLNTQYIALVHNCTK